MTEQSKSAQIAFLGMGIMGASMAVNLAKAGCNLRVWNRSADNPGIEKARTAGAAAVDNLAQAVENADIVFTCLGDVEDVDSVLTQVAANARPGTIVVDTTTIGPDAARNLSEKLERSGLHFMDAPLTGGDVGAREGTLTIMVGGSQEDFDRCLPYLQMIGKRIQLCGPVGSGQALKLCNQILCAVNMVAVCEAFNLADELSIPRELVVDVLKDGAGGSWALNNLGARIVRGDLKPGFMLKHMIKDLRLINENVNLNETNLPGMVLAEKMFKSVAESQVGSESFYGTQAMIEAYSRCSTNE